MIRKKSKTFKAHDVEGYKLIVTYEKKIAQQCFYLWMRKM